MSLIKGRQEDHLLLDFSGKKYSKNKIRKALKGAEVISVVSNGEFNVYIQYYIKVGMYYVWLWLHPGVKGKLKDCDSVQWSVSETFKQRTLSPMIDSRFRKEYWVKLETVTINDLTNIIAHCQRLNNLTIFL